MKKWLTSKVLDLHATPTDTKKQVNSTTKIDLEFKETKVVEISHRSFKALEKSGGSRVVDVSLTPLKPSRFCKNIIRNT